MATYALQRLLDSASHGSALVRQEQRDTAAAVQRLSAKRCNSSTATPKGHLFPISTDFDDDQQDAMSPTATRILEADYQASPPLLSDPELSSSPSDDSSESTWSSISSGSDSRSSSFCSEPRQKQMPLFEPAEDDGCALPLPPPTPAAFPPRAACSRKLKKHTASPVCSTADPLYILPQVQAPPASYVQPAEKFDKHPESTTSQGHLFLQHTLQCLIDRHDNPRQKQRKHLRSVRISPAHVFDVGAKARSQLAATMSSLDDPYISTVMLQTFSVPLAEKPGLVEPQDQVMDDAATSSLASELAVDSNPLTAARDEEEDRLVQFEAISRFVVNSAQFRMLACEHEMMFQRKIACPLKTRAALWKTRYPQKRRGQRQSYLSIAHPAQ